MKRIRFNIANLLAIIFILGVGFAALRESSDLWESGIFKLTIGVLLISILLAIHRTETRRAFWIGFALFGWVYLGLSLVPSIESRFISTKALAYLCTKVASRSLKTAPVRHAGNWRLARAIGSRLPIQTRQNVNFTEVGHQRAMFSQGQVWLFDRRTGRLLNGWNGTTENFIRIGHSLFALVVGWLGGQLSRRICRSSRSPEPTLAVEAQGPAP